MSEYWVSKKKYFCQYCDIFIADDVPSRSHHENGMRHKGNKERFVRGLYKAGEKMKKDAEEEKREMKNIETAAQKAYALDVGAGRGGIGGSAVPAPKAPLAPPKKPSNPYANYTTAASLGYTDPDAERINAENERKRTQGVAGEWEFVPVAPAPPSETLLAAPANQEDVKPTEGETVMAGAKRAAEAPVDDDEDGRGWKLRKKTARLGDVYDPGEIPIILKVKKEETSQAEGLPVASGSGEPVSKDTSAATDLPKWTKTQWKRATDPVEPTSSATNLDADASPLSLPLKGENLTNEEHIEPALEVPASLSVKAEPLVANLEPSPAEPPSSSGATLFKKRKARSGPVGGGKRDKF